MILLRSSSNKYWLRHHTAGWHRDYGLIYTVPRLQLSLLYQFFPLTRKSGMTWHYGQISDSSCYFSLVRSFTYTPHAISVWWGVSLTALPMLVIVSEDRVSCTRLRMQDWREFSAAVHSSSWWLQPGLTGTYRLLYCFCNDYTKTVPDIIFCPNKDARARSVRLQLGTPHIHCSARLDRIDPSWY